VGDDAPHHEHPVTDMTDLKGSYFFTWEDNGPAGGDGGRKGGGPPDGATVPAPHPGAISSVTPDSLQSKGPD